MILGLGAALRLWQYGVGASQWLDELALSRGIVGLPFSHLMTGRLPFDQVAPRGFILIEKAAVVLAGDSDYVLRLFPLVSSLASLLLFYLLARTVLVRPSAIVVALAMFALQPELIRYSAQVKPYSSDLAVGLALTILATSITRADAPPTMRRGLWIGSAGAIAVLISNAAVLVLAGLSLAVLLSAVTSDRRRPSAAVVATMGLWALSAGAGVLIADRARTPQLQTYLREYWRPWFGPGHHNIANDAVWMVKALIAEFGALRYPWPVFYTVLAVLGFVSLWRSRKTLALILFLPVGVTLAAADLHLYPFAVRLVLFAVPSFILGVVEGIEALSSAWRKAGKPSAATAGRAWTYGAALLPAVFAIGVNLPPYLIEEMRPILRDVASRRLPGDAIYVFYGAGQAMSFYGPRYGFDRQDFVIGGCHLADRRAYLHEVDAFRGRPRLWVLISHDWRGERLALLDYLDHLGQRRLTTRAPARGHHSVVSEAYLYDLSEARMAPGVDATSFPVPGPGWNPLDSRFPCRGGENPIPDIPLEPIPKTGVLR